MRYRDREGNTIEGTTNQDKLLQQLYSKVIFRKALKILSAPLISQVVGKVLDSRVSTLFIDSFVNKNHIKMSEYQPKKYRSYNDFFTRKVKPSKRPIDREETTLIAPSDGKVSVYPIDKDAKFQIKNSSYSVETLLKNKALAEEYLEGTCVIIRLSVDNYHRFCYVDTANKEPDQVLLGRLYTVNPIILDHVNIYKENSRTYCVLHTKNFDKVIQMEVGALVVGKIHNYHGEAEVERGQEKGKFEFGGSTVVLLLKKDAAILDSDLVTNTQEGYETLVKMGEHIGTAK